MAHLVEIHAWAQACAYTFPNPADSDPDGTGLIVLGADLRPETLIGAYLQGYFPWFNRGEPIAWWCPEPRCVMLPETFSPSKSLYKRVKSAADWYVSLNLSFHEVIHACSLPRAYSDDTWIHDAMKAAYGALHELGVAFSLEVWAGNPVSTNRQDCQLIGGLYGLQMGRMVFGESMFHHKTDASKVAFWALNRLCVQTGVRLIDCQLENPHLMRLGATQMARQDFLKTLTAYTGCVLAAADDTVMTMGRDRADMPDWQQLTFAEPVSWLLADMSLDR